MAFNTGNPIGSTDARDLSDNAENFDKALNSTEATWVDRLGGTRDSFEGALSKLSFYRVGSFTTGATLTNMRQTLEYSGHEYSWAGTFPKVVAAGATPATSGGIGAGAWVDRTDVTLRADLASESGAGLVGYQPAGTGAVATTVQGKLRETVSVFDFMIAAQIADVQAGTASIDVTTSIQAALNTGKRVILPKGIYKITDTLIVGAGQLIGEGVLYAGPYGTSAVSGTVIKPVGMQNKAAISITGNVSNNKIKVGGFGIDMSLMTAGTLSGDFDVSGMTKGVYLENRHDVTLDDIEVFAVPANSAAFVFHSLQPGGGLYWGNHSKLATRTKLASGNSPTAKGFVLLGTGDSLTAQVFTDCTSYRGWYLKNVNNCQFIGCHAEANPKDGVYIDGGGQLTFIGGFYEGQGVEDAGRTYYQFYGVNNPKRVTLIGLSFSGNGVYGLTAANGFARINAGGAAADEKRQILGPLVVDEAGNVGAPENTGCLAYLHSFNSTVPTATEQSIFFTSATAGYDIAAEYSPNSGNYTFRAPNASFGGLKGLYLVQFQLRVTKSGGGVVPAGTVMEIRLGGGGYTGASTIKAVSSGQAQEVVSGSTLVRVNGSPNASMAFKFYHNAGSDLKIANANGAASDSWFNVCKVG